MSRKILILIAIALQILILTSFVVRYEILRSTGTTVYVPLRGYDPTDIFRWDYVNLSYELPYSGSIDSSNSYEQLYARVELDNKSVLSISQITRSRPESGIYFQVRDGSSNQKESYTLLTSSGKTLTYESNQCMGVWYRTWDAIKYVSWGDDDRVSSIAKPAKSDTESSYDREYYRDATIKSKSACTGNYRFRTTATDRWFVPEWTGLELEKKIREWDLYAQWKIWGNGAVIITDIINEKELPK